MNKCECRNSKTGEPKECYADRGQALAACEASKRVFRDGQRLTVYFCETGKCFHVGNSREEVRVRKPITFPPIQRGIDDKNRRIASMKMLARPRPPESPRPFVAKEIRLGPPANASTSDSAYQMSEQNPTPTHSGTDKGVAGWIKEAAYVALGCGILAAESLASATQKAAKRATPAVERGTDFLWKRAMDGLKYSADYLNRLANRLEEKGKN